QGDLFAQVALQRVFQPAQVADVLEGSHNRQRIATSIFNGRGVEQQVGLCSVFVHDCQIIAERILIGGGCDENGHFLFRVGDVRASADQAIVGDIKRNVMVDLAVEEFGGAGVGLNRAQTLRVEHDNAGGHGFQNRAQVFTFDFDGAEQTAVFD